MIGSSDDAPPPPPRPIWIVRTFGPRPTASLAGRLGEVARRTAWFIPLEFGLIAVMGLMGIAAGNAGTQGLGDLMSRKPVLFFALGVVVLPVAEELLCRGLPSLVSNRILHHKRGQRWPLGIVMTVVFAMLHNVTTEAGTNSIPLLFGRYLDTSIVPAPQFLFGLLLWDLVRRYGLWASTLSHIFHNFVIFSLASLAMEAQ